MEQIKELEEKYIELILGRCLNFDQSKSLMIHCDLKEHIEFAEKIKAKAHGMGVVDVCINVNDRDEIHEYLKNTEVDDIVLNPVIDKSAWNEYAMKGGSLLFLNSSVPGLMDDIPADKMSKYFKVSETSVPYYRSNVRKYTFPWCIVAVPNERWAKQIFPDSENAYEKLYLNIMKMCMVDRNDPVAAWDEYIEKNNYYKNELNNMGISKLHYTNSLGTDLTIEIPEGNIWINLDKKDANGGMMIANMPSYEIFTSPDYRKTNGIVYSSKPLLYNGRRVEDFYFVFKDGKVESFDAKVGKDILATLLVEDELASYLGEVALVPYDSPISNTGLVFNTTLFDENASCHLAVGHSFPNCFKDADKLSDEELVEKGCNGSKTHVDFMIGTSDLEIEAETKNGKVLIFKNGNFNI